MTPDDARRFALALPATSESAHMDHPDFRVGGKIFATLWPVKGRVVVKLTPEEQALRVAAEPDVFAPAAGAWGRRGWTNLDLAACDEAALRSALVAAWRTVAPRRDVALSRPSRPTRG